MDADDAPAEHQPDIRPVEQDVLDAVKRAFEREECDPSIAGGQVWPGPRWSTIPHIPDQCGSESHPRPSRRYIDFLESAGVPVEATCKAAKLPSANVWPGQFSHQADGGEPLTEEVGMGGARWCSGHRGVLKKSCPPWLHTFPIGAPGPAQGAVEKAGHALQAAAAPQASHASAMDADQGTHADESISVAYVGRRHSHPSSSFALRQGCHSHCSICAVSGLSIQVQRTLSEKDGPARHLMISDGLQDFLRRSR